MALSMDEQRILAEIERQLAADDPVLASSLTTFRRPGPGSVLRSPRARIIGSLFTVLLVAMISLTVYAMIPFRAHSARNSQTPYGPGDIGISASHAATQLASASTNTSARSSTEASATGPSAVRSPGSATARTQGAKAGQTDASTTPTASP